jgi:hypothetical protein
MRRSGVRYAIFQARAYIYMSGLIFEGLGLYFMLKLIFACLGLYLQVWAGICRSGLVSFRSGQKSGLGLGGLNMSELT